jgi:hypothetical protein
MYGIQRVKELRIAVFWDMAPCNLVSRDSGFLQNVGAYMSEYATSPPRRQ